jgi:hypothetical protein
MKDIEQPFGYSPRPEQSSEWLLVPAAMIEEARDSLPDGDARSTMETLLERAGRFSSPDVRER